MLGVDASLLNSLVADIGGMSDHKDLDMLLFGLKCSRTPQGLRSRDFDQLRDHGVTDGEVVELIAMSGLAVYANIMADATAIDADEMFEQVGGGKAIVGS